MSNTEKITKSCELAIAVAFMVVAHKITTGYELAITAAFMVAVYKITKKDNS